MAELEWVVELELDVTSVEVVLTYGNVHILSLNSQCELGQAHTVVQIRSAEFHS